MSYSQQKKENDQAFIYQTEQEEIANDGDKQPEFDVHGTALNGLHSHLET